jgi:two-component system, OmpR family, response regulator
VKKFSTALIIDDDIDICTLLKSMLNNIIAEVQFTQTLVGSKKLLKSFNPDIIFLDNNLPDGEGINLISEIKSLSPSSIIVFITASRPSGHKALSSGANAFLEKPLTYNAILDVLHQSENFQLGA